MKKRLIAILLCMAMMVGFLPLLPVTVSALENDKIYINETNFPDEAFRNYLLVDFSYSWRNILEEDDNGEFVYRSDIEEITELDFFRCGFKSLKGIEFFAGLQVLDVSENQLTELDLSQNKALTALSCSGNRLTELDVSTYTALYKLECDSNLLSKLDVSKNSYLTILDCSHNLLANLDVSKNTALQHLSCEGNYLRELDVSKNAALKLLDCDSNRIASLDLSSNTQLEKLYCSNNALTKLNVGNNLKLKVLNCEDNLLPALDLSNNAALQVLNCGENCLPDLYLGKNLALEELDCGTQYVSADCYYKSGMYSLNMSRLIGAENLSRFVLTSWYDLYDATSGIVQFGTVPQWVSYEYNVGAAGFPSVRMPVIVTLNETVDEKIYLNEENFPDVTFRTLLRNDTQLGPVLYGTDPEVYFYISDAGVVKELFVPNSGITSLKGIEYFTELTSLNCAGNQLSSLDLSNNPALEYLNCSFNQLTELDLRSNTKLTELLCASNSLTALNVSGNTALEQLYCNNNQLVSLVLSSNSALRYLFCQSNHLATLDLGDFDYVYNFAELEYDDQTISAVYTENGGKYELDMSPIVGSNKLSKVTTDEGVSYDASTGIVTFDAAPESFTYKYATGYNNKYMPVTVCFGNAPSADDVLYINEENFPDANFRSYLTEELFEDVLKEDALGVYVLKSDAEAVEEIYVFNKGISDMTGLHWFTGLTSLVCASNQLTSLDVSANLNLRNLVCDFNPLTALDVSNNTQLQSLTCYDTELSNLDVSKNTSLTYLSCYSNCLATLDLSANTALTNASCGNQQISGEFVQNGDVYELDMSTLVGSNNLSKLSFDEDVSYNAATGIVTFDTLPVSVVYNYAVGYGETLMDVTVSLTDAYGSDRIYIDEFNFPDANFRAYLIDELFADVILEDRIGQYVRKSDVQAVRSMELLYMEIVSLKGIEFFTGLTALNCSGNDLTTLDVSKNTSLVKLYCYSNELKHLDTSKNAALQILSCYSNELTWLDVSNNTALTELNCSFNHLATLDVSASVSEVYCSNQQIDATYVKNGAAYELDMNEIIGSANLGKATFDASVNYNAATGIVIFDSVPVSVVYDYDFGREDKQMDVTVSLSDAAVYERIYINEVSFPDANFRAYVTGELMAHALYNDRILGTYILRGDAEAVSSIDVLYQEIADLTGIEYFTGITYLNCGGNDLTSLDLSANTALVELYCYSNELTALDTRELPALEILSCYSNQLTELDVSKNTALTELNCTSNCLAMLDVRGNASLDEVSCSNQQINGYYTKNGDVYEVYMSKLVGTVNLGKVSVDDSFNYDPATGIITFDVVPETVTYDYAVAYGEDRSGLPEVTQMDVTVALSDGADKERIYINEYSVPDDNFRSYLINELLVDILYKDKIFGEYILRGDAKKVTEIGVAGREIRSLKGIEIFTGLTILDCPSNLLTELDLSQNTALEYLTCDENELTALDLSSNTALMGLSCGYNHLATLDLSANTSLSSVSASPQEITAECIQQNEIFELDMSEIVGYDNLSRISDTSGGYYDEYSGILTLYTEPSTVSYYYDVGWGSERMEVTVILTVAADPDKIYINRENFPDDNFRAYLTDELLASVLQYDIYGTYVLRSDAEAVEQINVAGLNIADLKGIAFFTGIKCLECQNNQLSELDVSKNTALTILDCRNNQLTALDVSSNLALVDLELDNNLLTEIDVSKNTALVILSLADNQLTALDVSNNPLLEELCVNQNKLTELDVSKNPALIMLYCDNTGLTKLDVSNNPLLLELYCESNALATLELSGNTELCEVYCSSQEIYAECFNNNGVYELGMQTIVGSENLNKVSFDSSVTYDAQTGLVTFTELPDYIRYYYDVGYEDVLMDVAVILTVATNDEKIFINEYTVPDDNFRAYLIDELLADVIYNNITFGHYIFKSDAEKIERIDVHEKNIGSLKGVEIFTGLKELDCSYNHLATLDLSLNTALEILSCNGQEVYGESTYLDGVYEVDLSAVVGSENLANVTLMTTASYDEATGILSYSFEPQVVNYRYAVGFGELQMDVAVVISTADDADKIYINEINFPDANFRSYLTEELLTPFLHSNEKGPFIYKVDAGLVAEIYVPNKNISDLTGIHHFTELTKLVCVGNQLTALDVSANTKLADLRCFFNQLTELDVSKQSGLLHLDCSYNRLSALDVSKNIGLQWLAVLDNALTELDVSKNTALEYLHCGANGLTALDVSNNVALEYLFCFSNGLGELDVSSNTALKELDCGTTGLTSLDVSSNTALTRLLCDGNALTELDVSANLLLQELDCDSNQLSELNLSNNTALEYLDCHFNGLAVLDLSYNAKLLSVSCYGQTITAECIDRDGTYDLYMSKIVGSENLNKVTFDPSATYDAATGVATFAEEPTSATYYYTVGYGTTKMTVTVSLTVVDSDEKLYINEINFPDASFRSYLITELLVSMLHEDENGPFIYKKDAKYVDVIIVNGMEISSLTGIEHFENLLRLECNDNQLTALDVSNNPALNYLSCYQNQLTGLDLSKNTELVYLYCENNSLSELDVSNNTALEKLHCDFNELTALDVSGNVNLTVLHCGFNQLNTLNVSNNVKLKDLYCASCGLTSLDVSSNTALELLYCFKNQLTTLDVTNNTALKQLVCDNNRLTELNVSNNLALEALECYSNQLAKLDLGNNLALSYLTCGNNRLATLDLSNNSLLEYLSCNGQLISAQCVLKNGVYMLDMSEIVGSEKLVHITVPDNVNYDSATGMITSESPLTNVIYYYDVSNQEQKMQVTIEITAVTDVIPVDTDNDQIADTDVEAEPGEGLTYVDDEGNVYIPVDSNVEDGNMDGEMDYYVEVTETPEGDYPYTDNFGNDYIPVDNDGDGEEDIFVQVAGDADGDGYPEDGAGNEYEGVDSDGDGDPDYWVPVPPFTIPVDTDNDEIADTDVEAEPGEGLTYVDDEGNVYIPVDSNVEDGNMDGETDFYVEVTENDDGDYPYTDNFGNDYIPVDVDGNGEPDVFVKVVGDEDNDGKPEDEAGNEYEGVDGDGDGDPDYWQPVEEETGFTASLAAPNEKYSAAADYFAAAGIKIDYLADGESYVAGHSFYISSEIACVVAISFDGGLTYSELVATAAEAENTYYFTLPELTGDFVIGIALKGDANGDATVDVADATRIQRYFTFDPDEPYNDNYDIYGLALLAADANSDDMVDVADATRIQRYFTFDPDEPYDDNYKLLWNVS